MGLFNKILIANRGEIASRIIRTCNRLGIDTVAIYSEADAEAPFVNEATEAICIGEGQAKKSYLDIEKVIQVAKETNVDAIHPGYGFLSENPAFVRRVEEEGITFIGPSAAVMELMGSKLSSRIKMHEAGIPVVPGSERKLDTIEDAIDVAKEIGYPVMLKASAGGGGIGMRLIHNEAELHQFFDATKQQAQNFFGDDTVFLEQLIEGPRHIEVQIAADANGNVVHIFERECSVQRKHQKVIEETLSPYLDDALREKLLAMAVKGAKHIGYKNVGTMEFIFDKDKNFYFLEMNTRLQVEHPVTEEITGLDLVEWQIKLAANESIPITQEEIKSSGHAIECRLYAEDPDTYFPSPGKIERLTIPEKEARFDFGVVEGSTVSPFYDPMIGKIIVHEENRAQAIQKMTNVLRNMKVEGIKTNLPLLIEIMENKAFQAGDYTTNFLSELKGEKGLGI